MVPESDGRASSPTLTQPYRSDETELDRNHRRRSRDGLKRGSTSRPSRNRGRTTERFEEKDITAQEFRPEIKNAGRRPSRDHSQSGGAVGASTSNRRRSDDVNRQEHRTDGRREGKRKEKGLGGASKHRGSAEDVSSRGYSDPSVPETNGYTSAHESGSTNPNEKEGGRGRTRASALPRRMCLDGHNREREDGPNSKSDPQTGSRTAQRHSRRRSMLKGEAVEPASIEAAQTADRRSRSLSSVVGVSEVEGADNGTIPSRERALSRHSSRGRHHSRRDPRHHQRAGSIKLKSPIKDEYVTISTDELQPATLDSLLEPKLEPQRLANTSTNRKPERLNITDMDYVFVDEGGRFRRWPKTTHRTNGTHDLGMDLEQGKKWQEIKDGMLVDLAKYCHINLTQFVHIIHGVYSGFCVLSLILLPSFSSLPAPPSTSDSAYLILDRTFRFLAWYSMHAGPVAIVFNILATLVLVDALDVVFGLDTDRFGPVWWKDGWSKFWTAVAMILFTSVSWISTVLMTPLDDRLWESQRQTNAGPYGDPEWFGSTAALHQALLLADLSRWRKLNCTRGIFGILSWIICQRIRVSEIIDYSQQHTVEESVKEPLPQYPHRPSSSRTST